MHQLRKNFTQLIIVLVCVMLGLIVLSMTLARKASAAEDTALEVPVSINALMVTLIDHSAHYIWDYGVMEREVTAQEWRMVEYYAIQLAGAGPLITIGGSGPLDDAWARNAEWRKFSADMRDAAMLALEASRERSQDQLRQVGNLLIDSCEGCHEAFKPGLPTEGMVHEPDYDYLYHLFR